MKFFVLFALALVAPEAYGGSSSVAPCGIFISYDARVSPRLPEQDGFSAGTYLDGSQAYVGYGSNSVCHDQPLLPGRISTVNSYSGPGVYMTCGGFVFDNATPRYFQASSRAVWVATNATQAPTIPGLVILTAPHYKYAFGRITVRLANGTSYTEVAKVHIDKSSSGGIWIASASDETRVEEGFEVLTCM